MKINKKIIEELTEYLKEFKLSEIEYAEGTTKVKVSRSIRNPNVVSEEIKEKQPVIKENIDSDLKVTSPIVGTVYLAVEPGGKKFVKVGQKIKKGQTIMIVEAMKTMNHVPSTYDGTVSKILVNDGEPVEFGQSLISIK
ncbi:MAG: biotin/lipoyl-containing protein [Pelagibacteraceae bacterium]|jgi:acetyl-CoA carboxylase biotin carboxyl carrier protein|nr:acetyl-CoA carboxylase biotin carboxyl carrier protein subunit [Candidatus Pelagibacter sp.]MDP6680926.1 biotin/lipoyl-containing protein [Pelagibacteraceae bacterium]|tara:strand:- start:477 stop:893 length:417 start_codon:yes stop_codon:yes gene_type:complete